MLMTRRGVNPAKITSSSPHRLWLGIFGLWLILLSGVLHPFLKTPGALQAIQLDRMLTSKQAQIDEMENQLIVLQDEANRLEKNPVVQEREIRRVLGYAAPNELIFDFASDASLSQK